MGRNSLILTLQVFILAMLCVLLIDPPLQLSNIFLSEVLSLVTISIVLFFLKKDPWYRLRGQYLKVSNLFVIGFVIVHFQLYVDVVLGNYANFNSDFLISNSVVCKASLISAIGLVSFFVGYLWLLINQKNTLGISNKAPKLNPTFGLRMFVFILFGVMLWFADWSYFNGNYGDVPLGPIAGYAQEYLIYSILGYIILTSRNMIVMGSVSRSISKYLRSLGMPFLAVCFIYLGLVTVSGDRGPVLQIGIALIAGYFWVSARKLTLPLATLFLVAGVFTISMLGFVRSLRGEGDFLKRVELASAKKDKSQVNASFSPNTMELAISVRTLHAAVLYTNSHGHTYGIFQGFQLVGALPGAGVIIKSLTGLDQNDLRSSGFLTVQMEGGNYDHGLGTTVVADIFLDFGFIGILVLLILFGYFVYYLEVRGFTHQLPSLFVSVLFFVFLTRAIYIGRATVTILFRESVLVFIVLSLSLFLVSFIGHKRRNVA